MKRKKRKNPEGHIYTVIDGKQRILSILKFLSDEFPLPMNTIYYDPSGDDFDISGKKYSQLSSIQKSVFDNSILKITTISEATDEEIRNLIIAYNRGKPISIKQIFKVELGLTRALEFEKYLQEDLFFRGIQKRLTKLQRNNNEDLLGYIRALILLSDLKTKSFDYGDMINFVREYDYSSLIPKIKVATDSLINALCLNSSTDLKNTKVLSKTAWTSYLKRIPYLLCAAAVLEPQLFRDQLVSGELMNIMPEKLAIRESVESNDAFVRALEELK